MVDFGEQCDDGNTEDGDGCSQYCLLEPPPSCGDGTVDPGEQCDDGNNTSEDGCDSECRIETPPYCGDGFLDLGEQCDDGNTIPGDGCNHLCRIEECNPDLVLGTLPLGTTVTRTTDVRLATDDMVSCGAGLERVVEFSLGVNANLQLDIFQLGDQQIGLYEDVGGECTSVLVSCTDPGGGSTATEIYYNLRTGRYYLIVEETAEASAGVVSLSLTVLAAAVGCGNGLLEANEVCDDGNTADGDGCSADCLSNESCGNGFLDAAVGEQCDDGNAISGDGCSADCLSNESCGNGIVDSLAGERCDDGNNRSGDGCSADCLSNESCGNGILDAAAGEQCDDGNQRDGDGCDSLCQREQASCAIHEDLGTLEPGVPLYRTLDVAASSDNWSTDCSSSGPEVVVSFVLDRYATIALQYSQSGQHNLGLYREGELTDVCSARDGVCISSGPDEPHSVRFLGRRPTRYYLIAEANSAEMAGTVEMRLVIEGCNPDVDLGVMAIDATEMVERDTVEGTDLYVAGCGAGSGRERVIAFELETEARLDLSWEQTGDHVFGLFREYGGACDNTPLDCFDPTGEQSGTTAFPRLQPGMYLLIVDAFDPEVGDEGLVTLWLTPR